MAQTPISATVDVQVAAYAKGRSQKPPFRNFSHFIETAIQFYKKKVIRMENTTVKELALSLGNYYQKDNNQAFWSNGLNIIGGIFTKTSHIDRVEKPLSPLFPSVEKSAGGLCSSPRKTLTTSHIMLDYADRSILSGTTLFQFLGVDEA